VTDEQRADSTALPLVHDLEGDLRGRLVLRVADEPGDAHGLTTQPGHRDERLVVVVVDVGEVAQLGTGQAPLRDEEPRQA
jgi:hypothetical protein